MSATVPAIKLAGRSKRKPGRTFSVGRVQTGYRKGKPPTLRPIAIGSNAPADDPFIASEEQRDGWQPNRSIKR